MRRDVPGSKVTWPVLPNKKFSARSTKMVKENEVNQKIVKPVIIFKKKSGWFVAEYSAPWQHCLAGHRVLIGKGKK
jgi:hypothetical protein